MKSNIYTLATAQSALLRCTLHRNHGHPDINFNVPQVTPLLTFPNLVLFAYNPRPDPGLTRNSFEKVLITNSLMRMSGTQVLYTYCLRNFLHVLVLQ